MYVAALHELHVIRVFNMKLCIVRKLAADMNSHPRLPASVLLRLVVFASVVSLVDGHQYFEGIYCGQDNCYECKRFVVVVDF